MTIVEARPVVSVGMSPIETSRVRKTAERVAEDIVNDIVMKYLRTGDHLPLDCIEGTEWGHPGQR